MLYLEQGPSSLVIAAKRKGNTREPDEGSILELLTRLQREIRDALPLLRLKAERVINPRHMSWVARRMVEAAKKVAPSELTAMSAVAGAVSEAIKSYLADEGFDLVLVNNGGDIAAYSALDETISIALGRQEPGWAATATGLFLRIGGPFDLGIATSGIGGRSLTKGAADLVTVVAQDATLADAAATFVCNATRISSPFVVEALAETVDPETDIAGETVTVKVGDLGREEIDEVLQKGIIAARDLKSRGLIMDAIIDVKGITASTIGPESKIKFEERYADKKDCDGC